MADLQKLVDELSSLTVLEAAELSKLLEEKWGVSAAAPVAAGRRAGCRRRRCCRAGRGADGVHRHPGQGRRQEDQRHQGDPHHHRPWAEGSQGSGRGRAEDREGRREQGRGREDQEDARGCRAPLSRSSKTLHWTTPRRPVSAGPDAGLGLGRAGIRAIPARVRRFGERFGGSHCDGRAAGQLRGRGRA